MKLPASMLEDMLKTVLSSLPYELAFEPVSKESILIQDLFESISDILPPGVEGHLYYHLKHIDASEKQQKSIRTTLIKIFPILEEFFRPEIEVVIE